MRNKNIKIQDMIDFVTGSDSELYELSRDEEEIEDDGYEEFNACINEASLVDSSDEDDISLINLVNKDKDTATNDQNEES